jgi:retron-type reverse transcriptase
VVDRFIQQALLQVLQPMFDPGFSRHSHGFRPGHRAHDAIVEAQGYIQDGRKWVVDVDLEQFFDCVNHDVLMGRLAKRIGDRRVLGLIRPVWTSHSQPLPSVSFQPVSAASRAASAHHFTTHLTIPVDI